MVRKNAIVLLSLFSAFIFSCKKAAVDNETQTAKDFTIGQRICAEIFPYVENIIYSDTVLAEGAFSSRPVNTNITQPCVSISDISDTTNYPFSFTLDFGNGCTDSALNVFMKGKLKVIISSAWDNQNAQMTINTDSFYIDNYAVNFNILVVNNGNNTYSVNTNNGTITTGSSSFSYIDNLKYAQTSGSSTPGNINDDSWKLSGNGSGTDRLNKKYTFNIIQPVIKKMSCKYPVEGLIDVSPEDLVVRTVDYGKGDCDETASVTINGNNFEFNLK